MMHCAYNVKILLYISDCLVSRLQAEYPGKLKPITSKDSSLISCRKVWDTIWGLPSILPKGYKGILWGSWPGLETGHITHSS